jgi:hypothetical protein
MLWRVHAASYGDQEGPRGLIWRSAMSVTPVIFHSLLASTKRELFGSLRQNSEDLSLAVQKSFHQLSTQELKMPAYAMSARQSGAESIVRPIVLRTRGHSHGAVTRLVSPGDVAELSSRRPAARAVSLIERMAPEASLARPESIVPREFCKRSKV